MKILKSVSFRNAVFATFCLVILNLPAFAQNQDIKGSVNTIWGKIAPVLDLLVGIGGIIGIFIIVWKLKSGDEAAKGQIVMLLGALLLWYLKYTILAMFGITIQPTS